MRMFPPACPDITWGCRAPTSVLHNPGCSSPLSAVSLLHVANLQFNVSSSEAGSQGLLPVAVGIFVPFYSAAHFRWVSPLEKECLKKCSMQLESPLTAQRHLASRARALITYRGYVQGTSMRLSISF